MLVIRFLRIGRKNQPSFKIVVTDKRKAPRGGRFVEVLGFYNPLTKKKDIKKERVQYWLEKGVQLSASVHNLLVEEKIIEGKKINVSKKKKTKEEDKTGKISAPATLEAQKETPKEAPKAEAEKPIIPESQKEQESTPSAPPAPPTPPASLSPSTPPMPPPKT